VLGTDTFEREGDRLVTLALRDIYCHAIIDGHVVISATSGYESQW
jgi:hypothetical protein